MKNFIVETNDTFITTARNGWFAAFQQALEFFMQIIWLKIWIKINDKKYIEPLIDNDMPL